MKIAIMQPYLFPYIGYFQLVNAVDKFIFYDDVNFIKKGFINKNNILINKESKRFTISCKNISQNKLINEIEIDFCLKKKEKFLKKIKLAYNKAIFFNDFYPHLKHFIYNDTSIFISDLSIKSILFIFSYLQLNLNWDISSKKFKTSKILKKEDRLISIVKASNANNYINSIGGIDLYHKKKFEKNNIKLSFIKTNDISYNQFNNQFISSLSILDIMMFNSKDTIKSFLNQYSIIEP